MIDINQARKRECLYCYRSYEYLHHLYLHLVSIQGRK